MTIYLTTDPVPADYAGYRCLIWTERPVRKRLPGFLAGGGGGIVWSAPGNPPNGQSPATMRRVLEADLAALGFPPPGKCREFEIPPYGEGE